MTRDTHLKEIRAACIAANPEIAADTRATRQETLDFAYDDFLKICKEISKEDSGRTWAGAAIAFERVKKLSAYAAMFQDRPIRLADVLLAIGYAPCDMPTFDVYGDSLGIAREVTKTKYYDRVKWNLRTDDLTAQSPECIAFIHNLLTV